MQKKIFKMIQAGAENCKQISLLILRCKQPTWVSSGGLLSAMTSSSISSTALRGRATEATASRRVGNGFKIWRGLHKRALRPCVGPLASCIGRQAPRPSKRKCTHRIAICWHGPSKGPPTTTDSEIFLLPLTMVPIVYESC